MGLEQSIILPENLLNYLEIQRKITNSTLYKVDGRNGCVLTSKELVKIFEFMVKFEPTLHVYEDKHFINHGQPHDSYFSPDFKHPFDFERLLLQVEKSIRNKAFLYNFNVMKDIREPSGQDLNKGDNDYRIGLIIPSNLINQNYSVIGYVNEFIIDPITNKPKLTEVGCEYLFISLSFPDIQRKVRVITIYPVSKRSYDQVKENFTSELKNAQENKCKTHQTISTTELRNYGLLDKYLFV